MLPGLVLAPVCLPPGASGWAPRPGTTSRNRQPLSSQDHPGPVSPGGAISPTSSAPWESAPEAITAFCRARPVQYSRDGISIQYPSSDALLGADKVECFCRGGRGEGREGQCSPALSHADDGERGQEAGGAQPQAG